VGSAAKDADTNEDERLIMAMRIIRSLTMHPLLLFLRKRESSPCVSKFSDPCWMPAFAGMTKFSVRTRQTSSSAPEVFVYAFQPCTETSISCPAGS
jgi:hypothetical protein